MMPDDKDLNNILDNPITSERIPLMPAKYGVHWPLIFISPVIMLITFITIRITHGYSEILIPAAFLVQLYLNDFYYIRDRLLLTDGKNRKRDIRVTMNMLFFFCNASAYLLSFIIIGILYNILWYR